MAPDGSPSFRDVPSPSEVPPVQPGGPPRGSFVSGGRLVAALLAGVAWAGMRSAPWPQVWAWILTAEVLWIPLSLLAGESAGKRRSWRTGSGFEVRLGLGMAMLVPGAWFARGAKPSIWLLLTVGPAVTRLWESLSEPDPARSGLCMQRQAIRGGVSLLLALLVSVSVPGEWLGIVSEATTVGGGGLWEREPIRAYLAAALYFGVLAVAP